MKKCIIALFLLVGLSLHAQEQGRYWIGSLEGMLVLELRITEENGAYQGHFRSPMQGNQSFPATVERQGDSITWRIAQLQIQFTGVIDKESQLMSGQFKQGAFAIALSLQPSDRAFSLSRPQTPKEPLPYPTEEICIQNGKVKLCGTLSLPPNAKKAPLVILLTGSGAQNRDEEIFGHKPFAVIADTLAKAGIACFRMDDRGTGKSGGNLGKISYADLSQDLNIAIEELSKHKKIDRKRISLLGHSEGASFVLMAMATHPQLEKGICLAGPGVRGKNLLLMQNQRIFQGKISDSLIARRVAIIDTCIDISLSDFPEADKKSRMQQKIREGLTGLTSEQKNSMGFSSQTEQAFVQQLLMSIMQELLRFDPLPYLRRIEKPMLILNGEKDQQVDAATNLEGFRQGLTQANNTHFRIKSYPDLNHLFQHCQSGDIGEYAAIEETVSTEVLGDIVRFLTTKTQK